MLKAGNGRNCHCEGAALSNPFFGGTGILPVIKRQARCLSHQGSSRPGLRAGCSRDAGAYDLVAAGVPARHFPAPGSKSGVTNNGQSHVPSGTVPPMRLLSRGTRDFTPRNDRATLPCDTADHRGKSGKTLGDHCKARPRHSSGSPGSVTP